MMIDSVSCGKRYAGNLHVRRFAAFALAAFCVACAFADYTYSAVPGDVSQVVVTNNTTTAGSALYRDHLKQYWTFDDASDMFKNKVGDLSLAARSGSTVERRTGSDAKIGDGALFTSDGVAASENVIDGTKPFTVMFWLKKQTWTDGQHTILYIGEKPITDGGKIQDKHFIRVCYGNKGSYGIMFFWENQMGNTSWAGKSAIIGASDSWFHFALTCEPVVQEGAVTTNSYIVAINGERLGTPKAPVNSFAATDYLLFGYGWHYDGGANSCKDLFFDEIMIFDKALTYDEINAIRELTQPFDFSANWHMTAGSGTLDIPGVATQNVTGYGGTVTTSEGLVLSPERSTTYAGAVSGASLTLDAASPSVTQTLAGANSYVGETHVKTGVLEVNPMAAFPSLETPLVAYWPCDTLSSSSSMLADMSGNGNHLYPFGAEGDATVDTGSFVADGAIRFPRTENAGKGYSMNASSGRLTGFASADNSFTVAFWMRIDAVYATETADYVGGPFSFGTSGGSGVRIRVAKGKTYGSTLYFGDKGKLANTSAASPGGRFPDAKWRHFALSFDASKANGTDNCYTLYTNGAVCASTASYNTDLTTHAYARFYLGWSGVNEDGIDGALDDVVVLKGASAADVAALYNWRRGVHEVDGDTSVLPDTTRVVVDAGATLFITNANERVRSIAGAGTIHIAEGSSLYARSRKDFTGAIVGGGTFHCPGLAVIIQ